MMSLLLPIAVFLGVAALLVGVASLFQREPAEAVENRLSALTSGNGSGAPAQAAAKVKVFSGTLDGEKDWVEKALSNYFNLTRYMEQAQVGLTASQVVMLSAGLAVGGGVVALVFGVPSIYCPFIGLMVSVLPMMYVWYMRGRRLAAFGKQLPEALELISRALRSGHSLASGISLVAEELPNPIRTEFERVYESQNFGRPLEEALDEMADRVPNLDLRFFVTSVILQRQTGGDLAEILDKIGHLIRERFKIWGQIQALTGEGRLSGVVLLALPPVLFAVMWKLNPSYTMTLFTDPMGQQMLAVAVVMQVIGAYVIKKIIEIKV